MTNIKNTGITRSIIQETNKMHWHHSSQGMQLLYPGVVSLKLLEGKVTPKLVYFALKFELLHFRTKVPRWPSLCCNTCDNDIDYMEEHIYRQAIVVISCVNEADYHSKCDVLTLMVFLVKVAISKNVMLQSLPAMPISLYIKGICETPEGCVSAWISLHPHCLSSFIITDVY